MEARDAVVWINRKTKELMVKDSRAYHGTPTRTPGGGWGDPIGASYSQWKKMDTKNRQMLMLETIIELSTQGFSTVEMLREFIKIKEFKALGTESAPMCRALTMAVLGRSLEPNTMSFEELLQQTEEVLT